MVLDSLQLADAVKLSDEELPAVSSICGLTGSREIMGRLKERYGLRLIALTRGADGAILLGDGGIAECAGMSVVVHDTVGAGDAFAAAMAIGWLRGGDLARLPARLPSGGVRMHAGRSCPPS